MNTALLRARGPRWILVALATTACTEGSTLSVDLRTDLVPGVELIEVTTELEPSGRVVSRSVEAGEDLLAGIRVADFRNLRDGEHQLRLSLFAADVGTALGERHASVRMDGDTGVTLVFTRSCAMVRCPHDDATATECVDGRCVPPCPAGSPECLEPACRENADCPAETTESACTHPVCVEGFCFLAPNDALCAPGETCVPELGCSLDPAEDAGVDGGLADGCSSTIEECNADDDDCDGMVDEGVSRTCSNECGLGTEICIAGVFASCDAPPPSTEFCNAADDDCDGQIDEGGAGCGGCDVVANPLDPSHVYLFCGDSDPQPEAADFCATRGYHLVDVETEAEHEFVWSRAVMSRDGDWWIGLSNVSSGSGDWRWTDGDLGHPTNESAYNGWRAADPRESGSRRCAKMDEFESGAEATFTGGGWRNVDCGDRNRWVCEAGDH